MCASSSRGKFFGGRDFLPRPRAVEPQDAALAARRDDDEARRFVELVVEVLAARVGEAEAEAEAPVGERQLRHLEAQQALAAPLEAERGGVLRAGGEEEVRLVAELEAQARRRHRARGRDAEPHRERLAGEELAPLLAVGPE